MISEKQLARLEKLYERAEARAAAFSEKLAPIVNPLMGQLHDEQTEIGKLISAVRAVRATPVGSTTGAPPPVCPVAATSAELRTLRERIAPRMTAAARRELVSGTKQLPIMKREVPVVDGEFAPNGSQQRVLNAIAWFNSIGVRSPSKSAVGFVAGIKPTGGHFSNTVGPLSTNGLIQYTAAGDMQLTSAGAAFTEPPGEPPDLASYHEKIRKILKSGSSIRVFNAIVDLSGMAGADAAIEDIGAAAGIDPSGGHFSNTIGPLGTLGLITRRGGMVTPTELMFPPALMEVSHV